MFRRKDKYQVIKIQHTERTTIKTLDTHTGSMIRQIGKEENKKIPVTLVLLVKNGELCVKEFNGHWELDDIKKLEEA